MQYAQILFLGGGNITRAMISGLIQNGHPAQKITVIDRHQDKCALFSQNYHITTFQEVTPLAVQNATVIFLAVKPQSADAACRLLQSNLPHQTPLIISVMTGITTTALAQYFGPNPAIIRAMPNTPSAVQSGATALFANRYSSKLHKNLAETLLRAVGVISWLDHEEELSAIIALSGSGPAYYFYFMEIMEQVAVKMGISSETAHLFAAQTAYGAAKLALESPEAFSTLRSQVTSKGGTTAAALTSMQQDHLATVLEKAMIACQNRALELAQGS